MAVLPCVAQLVVASASRLGLPRPTSSIAFAVRRGAGTASRQAGQGARRPNVDAPPARRSHLPHNGHGRLVLPDGSPRRRGLAFASIGRLRAVRSDGTNQKFVNMQKERSSKIREEGGGGGERKNAGTAISSGSCSASSAAAAEDHLNHQRATFDSLAEFFNSDEATPDEVKPIVRGLVRRSLERMVESFVAGVERRNRRAAAAVAAAAAESDGGDEEEEEEAASEEEVVPTTFRILDVACGTGALFRYYVEEVNKLGIDLSVTAVDLSPRMTTLAEGNARDVLETCNKEGGGERREHRFEVLTGDFVELVLGSEYDGDGDGVEDEGMERYKNKFDAVVINASFGNFLDTSAVMTAAAQSLSKDGVLCVTHPLGAEFVKRLHEEDPDTVPHCLPSKDAFSDLCLSQPLQVVEFVEEMDIDDGGEMRTAKTFFASARRAPHRALPQLIRLRGPVAEGFGRGGKKLGFPTANLPSSLFADALANINPGVYFGWAVIEDDERGKSGRNKAHKAVVNVGYSPTFAGSENREKIVEAHLMPTGKISGDFYNETMRLALSGFLRPERKFPSFADLIAAITNDVACAKEALDLEPFASLQTESFIADPCSKNAQERSVWKGKDGGDAAASWEFQDIKETIG